MTTDQQRRTTQRALVREGLDAAPGFISAGQLHRKILDADEAIGLATVYRHLNGMAARGEIDVVSVSSERLFRACTPEEHHHHLVCETCGKAVDLAPPEETWIREVAEKHGFSVTSHVLEIFGKCAECTAR